MINVDPPITWLAIHKPIIVASDSNSDRPTLAIRDYKVTNDFSYGRYNFPAIKFHLMYFQTLPGSLLDFKVDELGVVAVLKNASGCGIQLLNVLPACNHCKRLSSKPDQLKKCSRCASALYCSKECQIADWNPHHKAICNKVP